MGKKSQQKSKPEAETIGISKSVKIKAVKTKSVAVMPVSAPILDTENQVQPTKTIPSMNDSIKKVVSHVKGVKGGKKDSKGKTYTQTVVKEILEKDLEELELEAIIFGSNDIDNIQETMKNTGTELLQPSLLDASISNEIPAEVESIDTLGFFIDTDAQPDLLLDRNADPELPEELEVDVLPNAAWNDNDSTVVNIQDKKRLRKLKRTWNEIDIDSMEYEERLRHQYMKLNPTPDWAAVPDLSAPGSDGNLSVFKTTQKLTSNRLLNPDRLDISRLKDANQTEYSQSTVLALSFHPRAPVLLTAGLDKTLRLFHIDCKENPKVQSFHFKDLPIHSAVFSPDGNKIVVTGRREYFYVLDLETGDKLRVNGIRGHPTKSLERSYISPQNHHLILSSSAIHLLSKTHQWRHTLNLSVAVSCVAFDDIHVYALGSDGSIWKWVVETGVFCGGWKDEGCLWGTAIDVSNDGRWVAVGSSSGVVNLYSMDQLVGGTDGTFETLKPIKTVMSLTTSITTLKFHPSSKLLVLASNAMKDALRVVEMDSLKVVRNWPTAETPLGYVFSVAFSDSAVCVGNDKGKTLMYQFGAFSK